MVTYAALFEPVEEGGFVITFPDFPCGATQAETEEEGTEVATDFLGCAIGVLIQDGKELPAAKSYRGKKYRLIQPHVLVAVKAELYRAFMSSGIRKAELARRLGIPKANVDRLFNVRHSSRVEHLEAAFRVIGMQMSISVRRAA